MQENEVRGKDRMEAGKGKQGRQVRRQRRGEGPGDCKKDELKDKEIEKDRMKVGRTGRR